MALKLSAPLEKDFPLDKTDALFGTEGTRVRIRQATQAQHERRASLFATLIREYPEGDTNSVRYVQRFSLPELMRIEAYLTLIDSNIEDEASRPLFQEGMNEAQFTRAWGRLPPAVAMEIHDRVLEVNPDWRPEGEV
jgi:hypothetical protein